MSAVERLGPMEAALTIAATPQECGDLAAKAQAVMTWAKHIKLSRVEQNRVARFRLDCMRKAGAMLAQTVRRGRPKSSHRESITIDKNDSSRWQALARIDERHLEAYVQMENATENGEVTHAGFLRYVSGLAKQERREAACAGAVPDDRSEEDIDEFVEQAKRDSANKFACIYADPPWQYGNQGTRAATDNHYPTMPLDDICALPVAELAADNAHLHLWTTNAFLFDAKRVMESWGFTYKSCFVWVKPQMGIGNYWRVSHEFLLFGVRGDCPFLARDKMSWSELPRGRHSAKPDAIRRMIEQVSPAPRLEMFAREAFHGWSVWGNQLRRGLFNQ